MNSKQRLFLTLLIWGVAGLLACPHGVIKGGFLVVALIATIGFACAEES